MRQAGSARACINWVLEIMPGGHPEVVHKYLVDGRDLLAIAIEASDRRLISAKVERESPTAQK